MQDKITTPSRIAAHAITALITSAVWLLALIGGSWLNDWNDPWDDIRAVANMPLQTLEAHQATDHD